MTDPTAVNLSVRGNSMNGRDQVLSMPRAGAYFTAVPSIPSALSTVLNWDTILYNEDGMWKVSVPSRFTAGTGGVYLFTTWINWASNSTSFRDLNFIKNGSTSLIMARIVTQPSSVTITGQSLTAQINLDAGEYVEVMVGHNIGGSPGTLQIGGASPTDRENGFQACLLSTP